VSKMKCLYCGAEIPKKTEDSKGRSHTKKAKFCRGTNHYRLWWNAKNKEYKRQQEKARYQKKKTEKGKQ